MQNKDKPTTELNIEKLAKEFFIDHPDVKIAMEIFGITYEKYKQILLSQTSYGFVTTNTTTE